MLGLVVTNLARRKARAAATAVGIALGIATIVALLSVGSGLQRTAGQLVHLGDADLGLFQSGVSDPTASLLPTSMGRRLEARSDVTRAAPLLLLVESIKPQPAAVVFGARPDDFFAKRLVVSRGRRAFGTRDVMVGDQLAGRMGLRPGSTLAVRGHRLRVAGIYHTGIFFEDTGAIVDLPLAQRIERHPQETTTFAVELAAGARYTDVKKSITRAFPGTQVIGTPDEAARAGANGDLVRKTVTIIAALALIVGGLGVLNTMAMAVLERRRELALLSAVGWRRRRVAALVLAEGVVTSVVGAGLGVLLGVVGAGALNRALGVSALVTPHVTPWTIGQALLIGVLIGVLGGLYPAWRGTSVSATELMGGA
ncbi:MAG TPA: ABC transporter permease [Solirubrobacteraceae bacterium]